MKWQILSDMQCDISAIESYDVLKWFNWLSLDGFKGPDDKEVSRRVQNTNAYKYKGPSDHFAKIL